MAEANLAREFANLFANNVDPHHQSEMHGLLDTGTKLTDTINQAKNLASHLREAKKDQESFNFEEFKDQAFAFNAWLEQAKKDYPAYFEHIESPFGQDLNEIDSTKFLSNIEEVIEKTHELMAYAQGKIPLVTMEMEAAQKMFMLITEIMIEGLRQAGRSNSSIIRNFKTGG